MVSDVTDQDFEKEVLKSDLPVMVDFWAPWCRPCQMIAPATEKLSEEFEGRLKFYKINVDENPQTANKYQVMSIPSLIFFRAGQPVDQSLGAVPESAIRMKIEALV